jgi:hypothetical protein
MADIEDMITAPGKGAKFVISCSRRTDIPAFYMQDFSMYFKLGEFEKPNGKKLSLDPKDVAAIMWWSKDYSKWIDEYKMEPDFWDQYVNMFQFTLNSESELEPGVPPLKERLDQLKYICQTFSPQNVSLRFDPICFYEKIPPKGGKPQKMHNLKNFKEIMKVAGECGIKEVRTSFCITYRKVDNRLKRNGIKMLNLDDAEQKTILNKLANITEKNGISIVSCAGGSLQKLEPRVKTLACIDGRKINKALSLKRPRVRVSVAKDGGQRKECMCTKSIEIGDYALKCKHNCKYCYANPDD